MHLEQEDLEGFGQFKLFARLKEVLFGNNVVVKARVWTAEIALNNCNMIVDSFLESPADQIDAFFPTLLVDLYADNSVQKLKYCCKLFLSLKQHMRTDRNLKLLFDLFSSELDYPVYNIFWETRRMILEMKGIPSSYNSTLNDVFLSLKQRYLVVSKQFLFSMDRVLEFEQTLMAGVQQLKKDQRTKQNLHKWCRNDELSATHFLEKIVRFFVGHYKSFKTKRDSTGGEGHLKASDFNEHIHNMITQASVERISVVAECEDKDIKRQIFMSKAVEKRRLVRELEIVIRNKVSMEDSSVRVLGVIEQVDIVANIIKHKLISIRQTMAKLRPKDADSQSEQSTQYASELKTVEQTSEIQSLKFESATVSKRNILREGLSVYKRVVEKLIENRSKMDGLRKSLKQEVFDKDFDLCSRPEGESVDQFVAKVVRVFGGSRPLSKQQILILDSMVSHGQEDSKSKRINFNHAYDTLSKQLISQIDTALDLDSDQADSRLTLPRDPDFKSFRQDEHQNGTDDFLSFQKDTRETPLKVSAAHMQKENFDSSEGTTRPKAQTKQQSIDYGNPQFHFLKDPYFNVPRHLKNGPIKIAKGASVDSASQSVLLNRSKTKTEQWPDHAENTLKPSVSIAYMNLSENKSKYSSDLHTSLRVGDTSLSLKDHMHVVSHAKSTVTKASVFENQNHNFADRTDVIGEIDEENQPSSSLARSLIKSDIETGKGQPKVSSTKLSVRQSVLKDKLESFHDSVEANLVQGRSARVSTNLNDVDFDEKLDFVGLN